MLFGKKSPEVQAVLPRHLAKLCVRVTAAYLLYSSNLVFPRKETIIKSLVIKQIKQI